jgi:uncharacterized protein (TIGR02246 family)
MSRFFKTASTNHETLSLFKHVKRGIVMTDRATLKLTASDEEQIRALYQALLEAWTSGDGNCYAALFSDETEYIVASGQVERGRAEIAAGHQQIFDTWAKNTRLFGQIQSIRPLSLDLFLVIATGAVLMLGQTDPTENERTMYSLIAKKLESSWQFVAYQNTPIQSFGEEV